MKDYYLYYQRSYLSSSLVDSLTTKNNLWIKTIKQKVNHGLKAMFYWYPKGSIYKSESAKQLKSRLYKRFQGSNSNNLHFKCRWETDDALVIPEEKAWALPFA